MPTLSIVIPAYNEEAFIGTLLEKILAVHTETMGFTKEIIVVNDGSKDRTEEVVRQFTSVRCFTVLKHSDWTQETRVRHCRVW